MLSMQILFITKKMCVLMLETFYFYKLVIAYYYLIYDDECNLW